MPLYPSFEGLTVGKEIEAQNHVAKALTSTATTSAEGANYAALASQYLGLDLGMIEYDEFGNASLATERSAIVPTAPASTGAIVRRDPVEVSQGVREIILCKDKKGIVGLQLRDEDKAVFVTFVQAGSPAALGGLRFGDQVLQLNGQFVAGMSGKKAMDLIKKGPPNNIRVVIRDRPLERCVTLMKDSSGHLGILIKDGKIDSIVKDSSAARNGVMIEHQVCEVNGINVLGMADKKIVELLSNAEHCVKLTLMPSFFFKHLSKK